MIKKLYDKCVYWAGKYAKQFLAFESFIESSFFPIPPDVMIIPMVIAKKKNDFIKIASVATIFSVLGALFGYLIGYIFSMKLVSRFLNYTVIRS